MFREIMTKALCRSVFRAAYVVGFTTMYVKTDPTVEALQGIAKTGRAAGAFRAGERRIEQRELEARQKHPFDPEEA